MIDDRLENLAARTDRVSRAVVKCKRLQQKKKKNQKKKTRKQGGEIWNI